MWGSRGCEGVLSVSSSSVIKMQLLLRTLALLSLSPHPPPHLPTSIPELKTCSCKYLMTIKNKP